MMRNSNKIESLKLNGMNNLLRLCSIVSVIVATIKIALMGNLTPGLAAFIIICGMVILIGNKKIYIIIASVAALTLFIISHDTSPQGQFIILKAIMILVLSCIGLYVMLGGFSKRNGNSNK
jgi:hypothetical protein